MFDPRKIIDALNRHEVEYVVIGGFAATLHGCPEQTFDLDIIYRDTPANRARVLDALLEIDARWDQPLTDAILQRQVVFALNTKWGDLDILNDMVGLSGFDEAQAHAQSMIVNGLRIPLLDLPTLIKTKEAAADPNPRKQAALQYLKVLQQRQ